MVFNSSVFVQFFLIFLGGYCLLGRRMRLQNVWLLMGSYFFYGWWDWRFLGLIALSTGVDYFCGRVLDMPDTQAGGIPRSRYTAKRRGILLVSIAVNLGVLGFFKYFDFFLGSAVQLLNALGLSAEPRLLNIILPVGISFYTFQTLAYTIDVYRGHIRAERSLLNFAVFVSFFPQLVAGPILRAGEFLPQIRRPRIIQWERIYSGGYLIFWGLFKKMVIADNLAILVDRVFGQDYVSANALEILIAVYAFAVQIYCDFSGYTDMARGLGRMLGFDLPVNFNLPYLAANPVEFWRRWHITLSQWLRDYLYIPLGGNRYGSGRMQINLMLTMLIGGLWHGAAWTFVIWGGYQGLLLVGYKWIQPTMQRVRDGLSPVGRRMMRWLAVVFFFHLVCLGWLIFRAESVGQVLHLLDVLISPWPWWVLAGAVSLNNVGLGMFLACILPLLLMQWWQHRRQHLEAFMALPVGIRALAYMVMFYGLIIYGMTDARNFIYFQF